VGQEGASSHQRWRRSVPFRAPLPAQEARQVECGSMQPGASAAHPEQSRRAVFAQLSTVLYLPRFYFQDLAAVNESVASQLEGTRLLSEYVMRLAHIIMFHTAELRQHCSP
jgi:hypothetical protein